MEKKQALKPLRIEGVHDDLHEELKNIASHCGVTISNFMRPKLRDISNSYPDHMKKPRVKE
jgi:hypothetical protein